MPLGIVPGSEVSTPSAAVPISGQPFREAALAKGQLAQGTGQAVGGLFQDVADKIQQNRNARQVFDADLAMRKTYDDFTAKLETMPDEGTWLPAWEQQTQQLKDQVLDNPHLSPDVKRQLGEKFDGWQQATTSATQIAALKKGVNESRKSAIADATYAANQGHVDGPGGANTIMDAAVENHAFSPNESERLKKTFGPMAAEANMNQAISRFPLDAPKLLPTLEGWDKMDLERQRTLLHVAREAMHGAQADNGNTWSEKLDESPDHTIDEKAFKRDLDTDQISQKLYDSIHARQKRLIDDDQRKAAHEDRELAGNIGSTMALDNFVGDKHPKETESDYMSQINGVTDGSLRKVLIDQFHRKQEAAQRTGEHEDGPIVKSQLDFMSAHYREAVGAIPLPGRRAGQTTYARGGVDRLEAMSNADFREQYGPKANREDLIKQAKNYEEAEHRQHDKNVQEFLKVMRDPKNADKVSDPEWVNDQRQNIERPVTEAKVRAVLGGKPSNSADLEAWDWAMAHPKDPRSQAIFERLSK